MRKKEQNSNWYSFENEKFLNERPLKENKNENTFLHGLKKQQTNIIQLLKICLKTIG